MEPPRKSRKERAHVRGCGADAGGSSLELGVERHALFVLEARAHLVRLRLRVRVAASLPPG